MGYEPQKVECKWQEKWRKSKIYRVEPETSSKPKKYILGMFPYPSGVGLHVGHARIYTAVDVIARWYRMKGFNVLNPQGWDAFGLPAENDAIKKKVNPNKLVPKNIANFERQCQMMGWSYDWDREINTSSSDYYKWTQWLFLKLYEAGHLYQADAPINWCPYCKTGLANEEVLPGGIHERCGQMTTKKDMKQWLFKITAYADRLLADLDDLDWPQGILDMQKNWIGRKEGIVIDYPVVGSNLKVSCFTTRPDTNFGATFVVLAPEHKDVFKLTAQGHIHEVKDYIKKTKAKSEVERISEIRAKTGVFTGSFVINRLNNRRMPVYISDFVLTSVGTGAVVGVPGHDKRDFEFSQKFGLPVIRVVIGPDGDNSQITKVDQVQEESGTMINSEFLDGMETQKAITAMTDYMVEKGWAKKMTSYHLRDWIFSRQRYWGEPIPLIHCPKCGVVPVPYEDLPVELPYIENYEPTGTCESPLSTIEEWVNVKCPKCGGQAKRETDTMPNWAGSCWYFLRFTDSQNEKEPFSKQKVDFWHPVDWYIGGAEHAVLHLLYARYWIKIFYDLDLLSFKEPFQKLSSVGMIWGEDGRKMSKSLGNVINPDDVVQEYGADTLRIYEMFIGPFSQATAWSTNSVVGCRRFLEKVWHLVRTKIHEGKESPRDLEAKLHRLIKKIGSDIENMKFNTAIAAMMEFVNEWRQHNQGLAKEEAMIFLRLLAPFAPHITEELWEKLGREFSIHAQPWPEYDEEVLAKREAMIIIQINGRARGKMSVKAGITEQETKQKALAFEKIKKRIGQKQIKKIIFVPDKIINFVV